MASGMPKHSIRPVIPTGVRGFAFAKPRTQSRACPERAQRVEWGPFVDWMALEQLRPVGAKSHFCQSRGMPEGITLTRTLTLAPGHVRTAALGRACVEAGDSPA